MYNNERVILFDENGSPYIAHAGLFGKSSGKKDTKYVDKIKDNKGKTRYFYTQEEVKAYYDNLKGKASNAVQNVGKAIQNAGNAVGYAVRNATGANDKAYAEYTQRQMRAAQRQMNSAKREELDARQAANRNNAIATARETFGKDGNTYRDDAVQASRAAENAKQNYDTYKYEADHYKAEHKLATERYANSPLGKLESTLNNAKAAYNKAKETIGNAASDTMNKVREATGLAAKDRRDAARTNYIEKAAKEEAAYERYANGPEQKKVSDAFGRELTAASRHSRARERAKAASERGDKNEADRQNELAKRAYASAAKADFDYNRAREKANDLIDAWDDASHEKKTGQSRV